LIFIQYIFKIAAKYPMIKKKHLENLGLFLSV